MDNYSKVILTIIAVALCAIAFKIFSNNNPTFGDYIALREIKDYEQRKEARLKLIKSLPLVRVQGGNVDVD